MEQLINAFGIDVKLITVQIINFLVLMVVLTYFLYNPILNLLKSREEKITQGIKDAEAAAAAKAEADKEKQRIVTVAHTEADKIAMRATERADEKAAEIIKNADQKAINIVATAEQKSSDLKSQALKDSEAEIAKLAVLAAEKVLMKEAA